MPHPLHRVALIGLMAAITVPTMAGEYAVLANGFRIHADRHETSGGIVRLFVQNSVTELPETAVLGFEREEYVPPAPPPPQAAAQVVPATPADTRTLLKAAAARAGLPAAFVESVAQVESGMQPGAVSPKGAVGVMQLMPGTARALAADPHDPVQNIEAGTRHLRDLLIKYDGDVVKALSAYNAGAGAVARYRGMPPFAETQHYVDKVIRTYLRNGGR